MEIDVAKIQQAQKNVNAVMEGMKILDKIDALEHNIRKRKERNKQIDNLIIILILNFITFVCGIQVGIYHGKNLAKNSISEVQYGK